MATNVYERSLVRDNQSAIAYEPLTWNADGGLLYIPTVADYFAGIYIPEELGTVSISFGGGTDANGVGTSATFSLPPGIWPIGGKCIINTGEIVDTSGIIVLF